MPSNNFTGLFAELGYTALCTCSSGVVETLSIILLLVVIAYFLFLFFFMSTFILSCCKGVMQDFLVHQAECQVMKHAHCT